MGKIEAYTTFAKNIARDDSHGYDQIDRNGHPNYDCSSASKEKKSTKVTSCHKAKDAAKSKSESLAGTYTTTANLNMRHGAGTGKQVMVTLPKGTKVKCYGYFTKSAGVKWLYVEATVKSVKYTGFCLKKYLKK